MVGGAVPEYRLPQAVFDRDFDQLRELGVTFHFGRTAGSDFGLANLRREGFETIVIMVGAQVSKTLNLDGEDCDGVVDALTFLRRSREGGSPDVGRRVGVIGAGDTAMDCARVARRVSDARVTLIYRRTVDQMPADREEIGHLLEEGIEVLELLQPERLHVDDGRLRGLVCRRMEYRGDRDAAGRKIPREVAGDDDAVNIEVPLDTLILAISQHALLDFFDDVPIRLNDRGYIDVDPVTFQTSVSGVYAGGDVVNEGPASIVKAAAAGKAIADSILGRQRAGATPAWAAPVDVRTLVRRRSHRQWRVAAPTTPLEDRAGFDEVVLTYDEAQARAEAARCLDCDTYCSLCTGVCPNMALVTYEVEPLNLGEHFRASQRYQVAVLTDFCNECGNCTTFCPTAGRPYRDKPRLYLNRLEFEAEDDNAFMVIRDAGRWAMESRWRGETHRLELNGTLDYSTPAVRARLDPDTFEVVEVEPTGDGELVAVPLESCAAMVVLLRGLEYSMPHLPTAEDDARSGRIAAPPYKQ